MTIGRTEGGTEMRNDVGAALGDDDLAHSGWTLTADLRWLTESNETELSIDVWPDATRPPIRLNPLRVRLCDHPHPSAERPVPGSLIGRLVGWNETIDPGSADLNLAGWLLSPSGPIERADLVINGRHAGRIRLADSHCGIDSDPRGTKPTIVAFDHQVDLWHHAPDETKLCVQIVARSVKREPQVVMSRVVRTGT
jgi:hypothetical protein